MKRLLKHIQNMSIGKKLYFSYLLVVLAPVSIVGIMLINQISDRTQKGIIENVTASSIQLVRNLSYIFQKSSIIIDSLILDDTLKRIASSSFNTNSNFIQLYNNYNRISLFKSVTPDVADIKVFLSNPKMMENGELMRLSPEIKSSDWFYRASENPGNIHLEYMEIPRAFLNDSKHLVLTYYLNDYHSNIEMLILLAINPSNISQIIAHSNYPIMIVNQSNEILFSTNKALVNQVFSDIMELEKQHAIYMGDEYYMIQLPITINGSRDTPQLLTLVPLKEMTRAVNRSLITSFAIIMGCLLLAVILIIVFSRNLSYRIRELRNYTDQVAQGNFDLEVPIDGSDEIGQLAGDLTTMVDCINQLIHDNEEYLLRQNALQIQHKNAQLRILANQINPHFLFNTLDTIRMNMLKEKDNKTAQAIQMLADLLRASLETVNKPVQLKTELKTAEDYLNLIKFRFGDSFNYAINNEGIDPNLLVLPFILQPIVENAVIHGLGNCANTGFIEINIRRPKDSANDVLIIVRDNGAGISSDKLEAIQASLLTSPYEESGKHIGILNVHKRLVLYYGNSYGLTISSTEGEGTVITAKLKAN